MIYRIHDERFKSALQSTRGSKFQIMLPEGLDGTAEEEEGRICTVASIRGVKGDGERENNRGAGKAGGYRYFICRSDDDA